MTDRRPLTDPAEAQEVLARHVRELEAGGHAAARRLVDDPTTIWHQQLVRGPSGIEYLVETEAWIEDDATGAVRLLVAVYEDSNHDQRISDDLILTPGVTRS